MPLSRCVPFVCGAFVLAVLSAATPARADEPRRPGVRAVAFSPNGKLLAACTSEPKEKGFVTVWDVATRRPLFTRSSEKGLPDVAFAPDSKTLAVAGYDRTVRLFDASTGELRRSLQHPKEARSVAFSPDGKTLATGSYDNAVRLWDLATGKETKVLTGATQWVYAVSFSPDGTFLLAAAGDGARLWDVRTGQEKRVWTHGGSLVRRALFTPNARQVLTAGWDGTVRVWDAKSGEMMARLRTHGGSDGLAYAPASGILAACGNSLKVGLYKLELREPNRAEREQIQALLAKLDDDDYEVREAAGRKLLSLGLLAEPELRKAAKESKSAEVRLRCRKLRAILLGEPGDLLSAGSELEGVAFSPDDKLLAAAGKDGAVRLWDVASRKELARLVPGKE
ncbi:MAG: WD40 repeat domain-containing protein [Planctomycetes bacterium]|nr:WD40 repeat domain-containing protein [Planctomycetota bacterium]